MGDVYLCSAVENCTPSLGTFAGIWSIAGDCATKRRAAPGGLRECANTSKVWGSWSETVASPGEVIAVSAEALHMPGLFFIKEKIMNIVKVSNYLLASGLALVGAGAMAQSATISFSGVVSSQTCVITASTSSGTSASVSTLTITLPTVSVGQLDAADKTAGKTKFYMGVASCTAPGAVTLTPKLYLSSTSASGSGYISTSISNLVLELLDDSDTKINLTTTPTAFTGSSFSFSGATTTGAEKAFSIRYRANTAAVSSGSVSNISMNVVLLYS